jgi:hypothetical protein
MNVKDDTIQQNLLTMTHVINDVFIPMETTNTEVKVLLEKYTSIIHQSMVQVTGTKTIKFPALLNQHFSDIEPVTSRQLEEYRLFLVS